jgi:hypothetical protein
MHYGTLSLHLWAALVSYYICLTSTLGASSKDRHSSCLVHWYLHGTGTWPIVQLTGTDYGCHHTCIYAAVPGSVPSSPLHNARCLAAACSISCCAPSFILLTIAPHFSHSRLCTAPAGQAPAAQRLLPITTRLAAVSPMWSQKHNLRSHRNATNNIQPPQLK